MPRHKIKEKNFGMLMEYMEPLIMIGADPSEATNSVPPGPVET